MLHPSYSDLMKVVNSGVKEGEDKIVSSRYSIVMATAKRARRPRDERLRARVRKVRAPQGRMLANSQAG